MIYEAVIGLEIHIQLTTRTKMFCSCPVVGYDVPPNTAVCPVCLGMPGALPVPNKKAVHYALMLANALKCKINKRSIFARKNYFYPDLPKGYQITQDEIPIAEDGKLLLRLPDGAQKVVRIRRIHLEEDAAKSYHIGTGEITLVDFNRCGVPLIEIVSEPDMRTPLEAATYVMKLRQLVTYLGICAGDMEKGNLRVDANVSVRKIGQTEFGTRTELKNLNSFRFLQKALQYEIERHIKLLEAGEKVEKQTLLWDERQSKTVLMRTKEESSDYRYFPEPDILELVVTDDQISNAEKDVGELPDERIERFMRSYNLSRELAESLCATKSFSDYADRVLEAVKDKKAASNWLLVEVMRIINEKNISADELKVSPEELAKLLNMLSYGEITRPIAKEVFKRMAESGDRVEEIISSMQVKVINDDSQIEKIVDEVLQENADAVRKYKAGKKGVFGFFMGQIMKKTRGQVDPKVVNKILLEKLES